jgi:hypothetical protein
VSGCVIAGWEIKEGIQSRMPNNTIITALNRLLPEKIL